MSYVCARRVCYIAQIFLLNPITEQLVQSNEHIVSENPKCDRILLQLAKDVYIGSQVGTYSIPTICILCTSYAYSTARVMYIRGIMCGYAWYTVVSYCNRIISDLYIGTLTFCK